IRADEGASSSKGGQAYGPDPRTRLASSVRRVRRPCGYRKLRMTRSRTVPRSRMVALSASYSARSRSFIEPPYLLQFSALRLFFSSNLYRHFARIPMNLFVGSHLNLMQLLKFGARRLALVAGVSLFAANAGAAPATAAPSVQAGMTAAPGTAKASTVSRRAAATARTRAKAAKARAASKTLAEAKLPHYRVDENGNVVPDLRAAAAIIYDPASGKVLWEENSQDERSIASITKVMTAVVFLESATDLDQEVQIVRTD